MPLLAKRIPFYRRKGKRAGEKNAAHTCKGMGGGYLFLRRSTGDGLFLRHNGYVQIKLVVDRLIAEVVEERPRAVAHVVL